MSRAWQNQERLVANWFGTKRNPLSGRNNRNDDGSRRLGDIIYPHAVVEVKRRQDVNMRVAKEVRSLARSEGRPWVVYEFKTGEAELVKLTVDHRLAEYLSFCLNELWKSQGGSNGVERGSKG